MAQATLDRFRHTVLREPALQEQLWDAPGLDAFLSLVQQFGVERGDFFTVADVKAALYASRRQWRDRGELGTTEAVLERWVPIRVEQRGDQMVVEWCYLGTRHFVEPFFEQTIAACLRHPFNMLFRHQTAIGVLGELADTQPGLSPSGFIFHMSRCGSTLVAQLLASLPQAIVIAEAEPIDAVLRAHPHDPALADQQRCAWLRWIISALGRPRDPQERYLFIKFDSWNILDLPRIRQAFPAVPWVFVYRDPVEVMVSHQRMRGSQMVPGMIAPARLCLDAADLGHISLDEYCARTLARICAAAARHGEHGDGRFVNYRQLPEIVWSSLLDLFGVAHTPSDIERMRQGAQFDAKRRSAPFVADISDKQHAAGDELRQMAEQWVQPHYERLIALQQAHEARR